MKRIIVVIISLIFTSFLFVATAQAQTAPPTTSFLAQIREVLNRLAVVLRDTADALDVQTSETEPVAPPVLTPQPSPLVQPVSQPVVLPTPTPIVPPASAPQPVQPAQTQPINSGVSSTQLQTFKNILNQISAQISVLKAKMRQQAVLGIETMRNPGLTLINTSTPDAQTAFSTPAPTPPQNLAVTGVIGNVYPNTYFHPAVADFNNDGWLDVFNPRLGTGCFTSCNTTDYLLTNNAVGGLIVNELTTLPVDPSLVAVPADFDGDGDKDVVIGNYVDNFITKCGQPDVVYLNDGSGVFAVAANLGDSEASSDAEAADLNGDGRPDIVVGNGTTQSTCGTNTLRIYRNLPSSLLPVAAAPITGTGTIVKNSPVQFSDVTAASLPQGTFAASSVELIDIDGDNDVDMITSLFPAVAGGNCTMQVFKNNGLGVFTSQANAIPQSVLTAHACHKLKAVDLDNDGDKDLVFTNTSTNTLYNGLTFLRNNGSGVFSALTVNIVATNYTGGIALPGAATLDVEAADVNNDGKQDLFVVLAAASTVFPALGTQFVLVNSISGGTPNTWYFGLLTSLGALWNGLTNTTAGTIVQLADFNNDGKPDVLLNKRSNTTGQDTALFYHL